MIRTLRLFLSAALLLTTGIGQLAAQPAITDHITPGGLPFRYALLPRAQTQAIQFGWRDGYALAEANKQGLANLGPALIMQGPKGITRGEFTEDVKDLQARMYLLSTTDFTLGGVFAPDEKFNEAVDLFARTMREPQLDPARLDEMKRNSVTNFRQNATNANVMANHAGAHLILPEGRLRDFYIGEPRVFESVHVEDVEAWRRAVFSRENIMIAAAGRASPEVAAIQIDRLFAALPASGAKSVRADFPRKTSQKVIVQEAAVPQTVLVVGGWSGVMNDGDLARARLAARILQARLFATIRGKLGAAYGATAQFVSIIPEPMIFSMSASVSHDKAPEALAALWQEHADFLEKGVRAEEVEPEKAKMISELREALRRAPGVAGELRNAMVTGLPANHVDTAMKRLEALSVDAVNNDIRTKLRGMPVSTVIIAPSAALFKADCQIKAAREAEACR